MLSLIRPIVFLDFETTGTNPEKDRIVEMAACKLFPDMQREVKRYLVNPGILIPQAATDVHGITNEMVDDSEKFAAIGPRLLKYIDGCDLGGFNSNRFDFPLMHAEFVRIGIDWDYKSHHMIDAQTIFTRKEERNLAAAVRFYCNREHEGAHGAEADINGTVDVFIAQIEKYSDLPQEMEALDLFCNFDTKRLDMAGKFVMGPGGVIMFNIGKDQKGKPAASDAGFLKWMIYKASFPPDTVKLAEQILASI